MGTGLVWFRNDLRSQDNVSVKKAMDQNEYVLGVYVFDPKMFESDAFGFKKTEKYRAKFLIESVSELRKNLEALNITLLVYSENPEIVIPNLIEEHGIATVFLQKEWTKEEQEVLINVKQEVPKATEWVESYDQFLYHPEDIPFEIANVPNVFTNFRKKCEKYGSIRKPIGVEPLSNKNLLAQTKPIPQLKDLGFDAFETDTRTAFPFRGGENHAIERIQQYFWDTKKLSYYKKTRNGLIGTDYSSKLSAWLANGSISPRTIYEEVKKYEQRIGKNDSTYWLVFELIWRDFFKYISLKHGNDIFKIGGILHKEYDWKSDKDLVDQWIHGKTDEPFVNANMIELMETGWMSNRGRQNVASFFAKEQELDWRIGAAYFESLLLDYDVHSNYGNWMYVAGVGNDPRDRKFNIKSQAERYDPNQKFQNLWLQTTLF
ncbi:DASH family cryptochrome [Flavobacteriaceae bacterium TP-CH-4]|uniref:Cryptochrome DASH n=1 Tax=Pelagihabitans pacificus TaxID=2696054 RepID=A0A967AWN0_9FLAO|nr:DASH family cryptochrome [Pelagihabitans pacificus]NHF61269.1 DASH family cryptochrome [Pelagihabitans pacificus]